MRDKHLDGEGGEAVCNGGGESSSHSTIILMKIRGGQQDLKFRPNL